MTTSPAHLPTPGTAESRSDTPGGPGRRSVDAADPGIPDPTAPGCPADTDRVLAERCQSSGDYLAGLIAAATLDYVGRPGKLPELLWPDAEPWLVRAVWDTALAVGYRAGRLSVQPDWTPQALNRLRAGLAAAGYRTMARQVARTARLHPPGPVPGHPADADAGTARQGDAR
ncbi:hypothetical protein [Streptomyces sp. NPDC095613]|uniref:hypothetical protein n=1 Tax=Streptomyces sp. NPDC095613 TaxID=3155540 RepID=UPI00332D5D6E